MTQKAVFHLQILYYKLNKTKKHMHSAAMSVILQPKIYLNSAQSPRSHKSAFWTKA